MTTTLSPPPRFTEDDAGCVFGSVNGQTNNERNIIALAVEYGYDMDPKPDAYTVTEAIAYLNDHAAPDDYQFGWYEGSFMLRSDDWWYNNY